jgi:hypothetical protein
MSLLLASPPPTQLLHDPDPPSYKMELQLPLRRQSITDFLNNLSTMSQAQRELRRRVTSIADANRVQEITSATPQRSSVKRRRSASPISISSTPPRASRKTKTERDKIFDAMEAGDDYPAEPITIKSADDLNGGQLKKCYEILHACGSATDPNASLSKTRQSIDGFLDAVFNEWSSRKVDLPRSELDFLVEAEVLVGKLCGKCDWLPILDYFDLLLRASKSSSLQSANTSTVKPQEHVKATDCDAGTVCTAPVSAVATYCNNPPMFKLEFSTVDELSGQPEAICPMTRGDIMWVDSDWVQELRKALQAKIIAKVHKHNKHLAIWQARKLIVEWAKGSLSMGQDVSKMDFMKRETADIALIGMGGQAE